jgi:hypothetical protein
MIGSCHARHLADVCLVIECSKTHLRLASLDMNMYSRDNAVLFTRISEREETLHPITACHNSSKVNRIGIFIYQ